MDINVLDIHVDVHAITKEFVPVEVRACVHNLAN